ncbi:MAG TPA: tRNA (adenosine(37)-N6)-threonylcarbamoyltransferase complex ATPase subunit type 1 TsaE [Povalibacter sp.]|nr:tRNA (adenosine(37)-N6)-threonylcarbamoyltransferase complex ATPase subunit type 1 TsaE [Povalibacter sp.]
MRQSNTANLTVATAAQMRSLGHALGQALLAASAQPLVIAIQGELGAGKTTLVGGILNAVGIVGAVRSPTYTLIEPYEAHGRHFFHLDLYRLADPQEVEALGVRDLLTSDAILLVEWPERGAGTLPPADLDISIRYPEAARNDSRQMLLSARGPAGERLLSALLKCDGTQDK